MVKKEKGGETVDTISHAMDATLDRDGIFASLTRGGSMKPMLRAGRDTVYITRPDRTLKKYDCIVYQTESGYTLHRIVGEKGGVYLVRGDNTYRTERVPHGRVLGVLSGFQRGERYYDVTSPAYRLYARLWLLLYPVRYPVAKLRCLLKK